MYTVKNIFHAFKICFITLIFIPVLFSCGGSSGSDSPSMTITGPGEGIELKAGETFILSLEFDNFTLNTPAGADPNSETKQVGQIGIEHGTLKHGGEEHSEGMTNPDASQGHVHIYLNDGTGKDPHITAWQSDITVILPSNISPGTHNLRIQMRDDTHVPLGSDSDQTFVFEVLE